MADREKVRKALIALINLADETSEGEDAVVDLAVALGLKPMTTSGYIANTLLSHNFSEVRVVGYAPMDDSGGVWLLHADYSREAVEADLAKPECSQYPQLEVVALSIISTPTETEVPSDA